MDAKTPEFERLRGRLDEAGGALHQKLEPALERWRAAAAELESLLGNERTTLEGISREVTALQDRIERRFEEIDTLADLVSGCQEPIHGAIDASAHHDLQQKVDVSTQELAALGKLLRIAEDRLSWLGDVNHALSQCPSWWRFMPLIWQERKRADWLQGRALFDANAYLERYPDVAQAKVDPLRHYIEHGHAEGRLR